jgi:hypothetical protein
MRIASAIRTGSKITAMAITSMVVHTSGTILLPRRRYAAICPEGAAENLAWR